MGIDASDRYLTIDKDWHALHVLLTGEISNLSNMKPFPPHLGNVVTGGPEKPFDATFGKVRFLKPDEVVAVADALSLISVEDLRARFDPIPFAKAEVYPNPRPGGWDTEQLESLLGIYPQLVGFFRDAAREGNVVLLSFDLGFRTASITRSASWQPDKFTEASQISLTSVSTGTRRG